MKVDSSQQNLASTFVNGFVNVGFGTDTLLLDSDDPRRFSGCLVGWYLTVCLEKAWIYKTKAQDRMSVVASIGLLHLWDVEEGCAQLDAMLYSDDNEIKAGAYLGVGK